MPSPVRWLRDRFSAAIDLTADGGVAQARERLLQRADPRLFDQLNALKAARDRRQSIDYLRALYFLRVHQPASAVESLKEELRYFPQHAAARELLESLASGAPVPAADPEFAELLRQVRPCTMLSTERLLSLYTLARAIGEEDLEGNFVECGVAAGGSSALLATVMRRTGRRSRRLFACDTFAGMPEPGAVDTHRGIHAEATGWGTGTCSAPLESLLALCATLGVRDLLVPVQGLFEETLPARRTEIGPIALLHMDGDWYSSTMAILENLYDAVVPGGRIQIDDYGHWEGCRKAVEEFTRQRGLNFKLHEIDSTGVWLVKE